MKQQTGMTLVGAGIFWGILFLLLLLFFEVGIVLSLLLPSVIVPIVIGSLLWSRWEGDVTDVYRTTNTSTGGDDWMTDQTIDLKAKVRLTNGRTKKVNLGSYRHGATLPEHLNVNVGDRLVKVRGQLMVQVKAK